MGDIPIRVFVSYTAEDLSRHADVVVSAIQGLDMMADDHRNWSATGKPSVQECKRQIEKCQILVVLVAHRYGWIPTAEEGGDAEQSITHIEVLHAKKLGLPVLPFVVQKDAEWRADLIEGYGKPEVKARLDKFKAELQQTLAGFFSTPVSLDGPVSRALQEAANKIERSKALCAKPRSDDEVEDDEVILPWMADSAASVSLSERLGSQLPKRILAIDDQDRTPGVALGLLQRMQEVLRIRYGTEDFFLSDYFDLIVGVGWSSFMATLLALRTDAHDVQELSESFIRSAVGTSATLMERVSYFYNNANLRVFLAEALGDRTLGSKELKTGLSLLTTRIEDSLPFAFTNHPGWHGYPTWRDLRLSDLVLASLAFPTFYKVIELKTVDGSDKGTFISGVVSVGGNPSVYGLLMAASNRFPFRWRLGRSWLSLTSVGGRDTIKPSSWVSQDHSLSIMHWMMTLPSLLSKGLRSQGALMFEALGLNTESFSSNAASAGNAVINYRRYELSGEAASSSDKPNPFEGQGTLGWEELPNVLRAQIEACLSHQVTNQLLSWRAPPLRLRSGQALVRVLCGQGGRGIERQECLSSTPGCHRRLDLDCAVTSRGVVAAAAPLQSSGFSTKPD